MSPVRSSHSVKLIKLIMWKLAQLSIVCVGLVLIMALANIVPADAAATKKPGQGKHGTGAGSKLGARKAPDDRVKEIVEQLELQIREKICDLTPDLCSQDTYPLVAKAYKKQIVKGNNYFIAVSLKDNYYHARILEQSWDDVLELVDVIGPKAKGDEIKYF